MQDLVRVSVADEFAFAFIERNDCIPQKPAEEETAVLKKTEVLAHRGVQAAHLPGDRFGKYRMEPTHLFPKANQALARCRILGHSSVQLDDHVAERFVPGHHRDLGGQSSHETHRALPSNVTSHMLSPPPSIIFSTILAH